MAESILRKLGGASVTVRSAGLHPTGAVAPMSLDALDRAGFPTDGLRSKGIEEIDIDEIDIVISLMGEPGLAALPCRLTAEKIAWSIRDPYGEDEETYDGTLRTLVRKIRRLCAERNFS